MSYDDDVASEQDGSPVEYFDIAIGPTTYYVTSGTSDIAIGGRVYTADAVSRGSDELPQLGEQTEGTFELLLRVDHPVVRRWFQYGIPPTNMTITAYEYQRRSGESEQFWTGRVVAVKVAGKSGIAQIVVSSLLGEPIRKRLPVLTAGVQCGHVLYDDGCKVSRSGSDPDGTPFKCSTTPLQVAGRDVRLDLSNVPADHARRATWLVFGELVVTSGVATGERRTIRTQIDANPGISTVTTVSLSLLIPGLKIGDSIDVYAGCEHDVTDCSARFANIARYSGFPWMSAGDNSWRDRLTGQKKP